MDRPKRRPMTRAARPGVRAAAARSRIARSGPAAEDVTAGGAQHLRVRRAEGGAKISRRCALRSQPRGQDGAADSGQVQVEVGQG